MLPKVLPFHVLFVFLFPWSFPVLQDVLKIHVSIFSQKEQMI